MTCSGFSLCSYKTLFRSFSWLFSIYLLAQTVTIPIYGKLADLYGRKPVLLAGTALFLAGSAACAAAWGMIPLIVFRGIQGLRSEEHTSEFQSRENVVCRL